MKPDIKILIAVLAKLDSHNAFKAHTHPHYQLDHIVRGEYSFDVDGYTFTAGVGDTVLIPANSPHAFEATGDETGYYFEVKFSSFSKEVMELCSDIGILIREDDFSERILREICEEKNNSTPESEEIMVTYLNSILFKLNAAKRREKNTPSKYIEVSSYSAPVRDTIRFLEDNYKERLTLDEIVAQVSLKKSHLSKLFKQETTVTIFECLMTIRVRKAVELLSYSDLSLAQISEETGFVNVTHFNRVFTKHVMIPPGQYRKYLKSQDSYWVDVTAGRRANPITAATLEGRKIDFPKITLSS